MPSPTHLTQKFDLINQPPKRFWRKKVCHNAPPPAEPGELEVMDEVHLMRYERALARTRWLHDPLMSSVIFPLVFFILAFGGLVWLALQ